MWDHNLISDLGFVSGPINLFVYVWTSKYHHIEKYVHTFNNNIHAVITTCFNASQLCRQKYRTILWNKISKRMLTFRFYAV